MVASGQRWALMHELRGAAEPALDELLERMAQVDLVIVEGFKYHDHPKIEVYRHAVGKPLLHPGDPFVVAIASDQRRPEFSRPWLPLSDASAIANFILSHEAGLVRWHS
jgi:molybdopterin-guanine dinucleotide biosynthesis adapter protein